MAAEPNLLRARPSDGRCEPASLRGSQHPQHDRRIRRLHQLRRRQRRRYQCLRDCSARQPGGDRAELPGYCMQDLLGNRRSHLVRRTVNQAHHFMGHAVAQIRTRRHPRRAAIPGLARGILARLPTNRRSPGTIHLANDANRPCSCLFCPSGATPIWCRLIDR